MEAPDVADVDTPSSLEEPFPPNTKPRTTAMDNATMTSPSFIALEAERGMPSRLALAVEVLLLLMADAMLSMETEGFSTSLPGLKDSLSQRKLSAILRLIFDSDDDIRFENSTTFYYKSLVVDFHHNGREIAGIDHFLLAVATL